MAVLSFEVFDVIKSISNTLNNNNCGSPIKNLILELINDDYENIFIRGSIVREITLEKLFSKVEIIFGDYIVYIQNTVSIKDGMYLLQIITSEICKIDYYNGSHKRISKEEFQIKYDETLAEHFNLETFI